MKRINMNEYIYDLVLEDPIIKDVLIDLGFTHLNNPIMFNSIAKVMTLTKAARQHDLTIDDLNEAFHKVNITIIEEEIQ